MMEHDPWGMHKDPPSENHVFWQSTQSSAVQALLAAADSERVVQPAVPIFSPSESNEPYIVDISSSMTGSSSSATSTFNPTFTIRRQRRVRPSQRNNVFSMEVDDMNGVVDMENFQWMIKSVSKKLTEVTPKKLPEATRLGDRTNNESPSSMSPSFIRPSLSLPDVNPNWHDASANLYRVEPVKPEPSSVVPMDIDDSAFDHFPMDFSEYSSPKSQQPSSSGSSKVAVTPVTLPPPLPKPTVKYPPSNTKVEASTSRQPTGSQVRLGVRNTGASRTSQRFVRHGSASNILKEKSGVGRPVRASSLGPQNPPPPRRPSAVLALELAAVARDTIPQWIQGVDKASDPPSRPTTSSTTISTPSRKFVTPWAKPSPGDSTAAQPTLAQPAVPRTKSTITVDDSFGSDGSFDWDQVVIACSQYD